MMIFMGFLARTNYTFTYDIFSAEAESEAIHLNLAGYVPQFTQMKSADIYMFMGDGGHADFSSYEGNDVIAYNTENQAQQVVGSVNFWKGEGAKDVFSRELIKSPIWNCDLSSLNTPGTYRIAIEGIGCSPEFKVSNDALYDPYKMAVRGYYYMRLGQKDVNGIKPVPRIPLMIPGDESDGYGPTKVYVTTYSRYNGLPSGGGDRWDQAALWADGATGETNPNAKGGHVDAFDWDRHDHHVANIYDILLPYVLHQGNALNDDDLEIAESGDGVPDIVQEAQYEVDFWLSLKVSNGYGSGVTNPVNHHGRNYSGILYQAAAHPIMAWQAAALSAMIAECYRLAGKTSLMEYYRDKAIEAYTYVTDGAGLNTSINANGGNNLRGRDFKMTAAAYLYNITGEKKYEDDMAELSEVNSSSVDHSTPVWNGSNSGYNQLYASIAYVFTNRAVNYPQLQSNLKAAIINDAHNYNTDFSQPSRRTTADKNDASAFWQSGQNVQWALAAHAVTSSVSEKDLFLKAIILEADYSMGRNPMNKIMMTGPVGSHYLERTYTTGQNDGWPGVHYGHTPYMMTMHNDCWWGSSNNADGASGCAGWYTSKGYPSDFKNKWPIAEGHWNTPFLCPVGEFTPRQTMKGKTALYAYLHGLAGGGSCEVKYSLDVSISEGSGTLNLGSGEYCADSYVNVCVNPDLGYGNPVWEGDTTGTGNCVSVYMDGDKEVSVSLSPIPTYTITLNANPEEGGAFLARPNENNLTYNENQVVTVTATPADGYTFIDWSDGSTDISRSITMDMDTTLTANFEEQMIPGASAVIDGIMDEAYPETKLIANSLVGMASETDLLGKWTASWDVNHLYIYVQVTDDAFSVDNGSSDWYKDDVIEVYIDGDNSNKASYDGSNDVQYGFVRDNTTVLYAGGYNPSGSTKGIEWTFSNPDSETYILETAIPWSAIGIEAPSEGDLIGIDIHINDDDDGGERDAKKSWFATVDDSWKNPSLFASVTLGGVVGNLIPKAGAGSDITITLPENSISVADAWGNGGDGPLSYNWAKISGGNATLSGTDGLTPTFSDLVEDTYTFELTVTDIDGDSDTDQMKVTVLSDAVSVSDDKVDQKAVKIYPNPSSGSFVIDVNRDVQKIEIFTLLGKKVFGYDLNGEKQIKIQDGSFKWGIYFVKTNQSILKLIIKSGL
ncbi:MAG: T9SS type A sorting domain-containing protein [Prolixibacteraceae bacterium]|nr:T9SS type A sorting domain-containing protein [Prolixibacteraceae bacterium]